MNVSSAYTEIWPGFDSVPFSLWSCADKTLIKYVHLISGGPGFPGYTVALEELVGGLVQMEQAHQFWGTGLWDGTFSCNLRFLNNKKKTRLNHCNRLDEKSRMLPL